MAPLGMPGVVSGRRAAHGNGGSQGLIEGSTSFIPLGMGSLPHSRAALWQAPRQASWRMLACTEVCFACIGRFLKSVCMLDILQSVFDAQICYASPADTRHACRTARISGVSRIGQLHVLYVTLYDPCKRRGHF